MSPDEYTEIKSESWFSRIKGAFVGVLFGIVLVVASFILLSWNEGRAVRQAATLIQGKKEVISISSQEVNPANSGKLVHISGKAVTSGTLYDNDFGFKVNALKLKRVAKMYQWKEAEKQETKKQIGGGTTTTTTYSYNKNWSESLISSGGFKHPEGHENPSSMAYGSRQYKASEIKVGAFLLSWSLQRQLNNFSDIEIDARFSNAPVVRDGKAKIWNGTFYFGSDPAKPQVGDLQVKFGVINPCEVSIIGKQVNNTFEPYITKNGGSIEMLMAGTYSDREMFRRAETTNKILTWALRLGGFLLMFIGFLLILNPLSVLADVLPILGDIISIGTGIIAFLVSAFLSVFTIAIAWFANRPVLSIVLIAAVVVGIAFLIKFKIKAKSVKS